ncbi:lytic polysaccharide monooxygenase auxiliary activity family 9 protein [Streptomyces avermitilis]|uniref:lytic polysaccharide monooxygenase auxiliary activity family 9 protein n=1 Tax=Streptomyces avermitilis TaxID=33903 RepID=UPI0033A6FB6A
MTAHRTAAAAAVAVAAPLLLTAWAAGPAQAHGAPTDPVSRVVACSPEGGGRARTAACTAAIAANGTSFTAWDNLRVAGVNGRDRQLIPDGKLCSGGLSAYKGLDLARPDWPSTRLTPGASLTMTYSSTIPHTGTFKLYLTKQGYDPTKPLTWADLPAQPFAQLKDPALSGGAYHLGAKLPADRTGRHVLFTIWQNTSTADTYYSCSDVVFAKAKAAAGAGSGSKGAAEKPSGKATSSSPAGTSPSSASPSPNSPSPSRSETAASTPAPSKTTVPGTPAAANANRSDSGPSLPLLAGAAAAVVLAAGAVLGLRRRRR